MSIQMMRPTFTKGDRLRKARELTGLDQKAFAEAMGLHRDSVRKYESTGQVKKYVLTAWADFTGVDEQWLEHGDEPVTSDYSATDVRPPRRMQDLGSTRPPRAPRGRGTTGPKGRAR